MIGWPLPRKVKKPPHILPSTNEPEEVTEACELILIATNLPDQPPIALFQQLLPLKFMHNIPIFFIKTGLVLLLLIDASCRGY